METKACMMKMQNGYDAKAKNPKGKANEISRYHGP
jgi:hypothetical protein